MLTIPWLCPNLGRGKVSNQRAVRNTGNRRIVVVFGMGESFRSIWTHNGRWLASINVGHAEHTANFHTLDPAYAHFHKKSKAGAQRVAETGRGHGTGFQLLGCVEGDLVRR